MEKAYACVTHGMPCVNMHGTFEGYIYGSSNSVRRGQQEEKGKAIYMGVPIQFVEGSKKKRDEGKREREERKGKREEKKRKGKKKREEERRGREEKERGKGRSVTQ